MSSVSPGSTSQETDTRDGLISALIAFGLWGVFPVYFVIVREVSALEVLAHRIIWSVPFGAIIIHLRHQWPEVIAAMKHRYTLRFLTLSAMVITANWLVYIWAVQIQQINQTSLGYYINPLLFALAGVVIFGERLRRAQTTAVVLAAIGVTILATQGGQFPAIALALGILFAVYGVIRKQVVVGGMPGLFIETVVLVPFALAWLLWLMWNGDASFSIGDPGLAGILILAGPLTVTPLLFFALAARRLNLSTVGMMQFIAPTLQFAIAVYYGEALTPAHIACFALIWVAVVLFSIDAWLSTKAQVQAGM
ncbi:MAG: EamA family transporter RarD [Woeseiaceae bacterium]|nr:EamA family transporter RarD [Woeseiaceae bacterium]